MWRREAIPPSVTVLLPFAFAMSREDTNAVPPVSLQKRRKLWFVNNSITRVEGIPRTYKLQIRIGS